MFKVGDKVKLNPNSKYFNLGKGSFLKGLWVGSEKTKRKATLGFLWSG